jgi:hypothetical protein
MADVNANIGIHIDSSAALAELKTLQRQLATFHASIAKNSAASAAAQKGLQQNLLNSINATGKFHAQMGLVRTSTESFTHALENNKLSMREYFRYAGASSKSFGKLFKSEFDTIGKVAEERVRKMQTQYIKMGRDASGALKAMSVTPTTLNMKDLGNQTAVAAQKQAIFNQLVKQGSTSLLNFGKNTQWAGRQLMVGFSVPLMYIGSIASKTFMDMEAQAVRFKRVYGDIFTTSGETEKAVKEIELLAKSFTKYGVALTDTMKMAADAAAMGKTGAELTAQISEATRLAVLGGVEQGQALETTISLTNAFGVSADQLASKINFLNAVENQTVVSIEDLTIAIPKAGPVIQQLGGDVEDLAFFLTAMKEGGINASEGANALKSGLAALINPSKKASAMLGELGININGIIESNAGNIKATVVGFAQALDTLDPLNRARAIEQLFGKFQFARLSTLFQNITKDGSQANKVLGLTQASVEELAILSQRELKKVEDAVGVNFKQSVEDLKIAIMPIGKAFLEALTPIVKFAADILKRFDGLSDGTKKFIVVATTLVGILGPTLLMTFGLVANGAANIIKLFLALRSGFLKLGGNATVLSQQTSYLNAEQLEAATVAASLNQAHTRLTQSFTLETSAVMALRNAYVQATTAALTFARANPGMMMPGFKGSAPKKFKQGATYVPGTGNKDTVPSMLTPGEAIIPANVAQNPAYQPIIDAMVNGNLQGFEHGTTGVSFGGKEYNAKSARGAKNIKKFLDELIKNQDGTLTHIDPKTKEATTFSEKRLRDVFDYRSQPGKELTTGDIMRSLNIGSGKRGTSAGTSAPAWVKKLVQDSADKDKTVFAEKEFLKKRLQEKGIALTQAQERNLFGLDAAHVEKDVTPDGKKVWKASNIVPEPGYINKYLNDQVHGKKFGKQLQALPDAELTRLGIDRVELDKLVNEGSHPTNAKSAATLAKIADYQKLKYPGQSTIYQAELASAGIKYRLENGIYRAGLKTLADRFPETKTASADIDPKGIFAEADADVKKSRFKNEPVTKYGKQIQPSSGYSFKEANHLSGVFEKPDGSRVFVKPMMDEKAALAEQRATIIARDAHGLESPEQTLKVIQDPKTGKKLFALESPYDARFAESNFTGKFTKPEYFKQLVAANLRGDKDLHAGNLSGKVLADVGTAGVFEKASGKRDFATKMPSMAEQANINLLGVKGGAKKFFAQATLDIPKNMSADQYHNSMISEIDDVLPKLKKTISGFDLNPQERQVYQGMITRLEEARKVDWRAFHKIHSGVAVAVQKKESIKSPDGKITKVTGQNTTALPKGIKPSTGRPDDSRMATPAPGSKVVTQRPGKFRVIPGKADAPGVSSLMGMSQSELAAHQKAMKNGINALIDNTEKTKTTTNRIKELGNKGNVAIGALSGLTIAGTFAGGKLGEMANSAMPFVFAAQGVSGIMSMMPDSMTKMKGGMIAATAVIGTFITVTTLLNKTYNDAQNKAMELSEATGASAKAIENFAVFANKATPGQILDERNKQSRSGFAVQQGKTSFGESYVAAPDNQALIQGVANNLKTNPKTAMQDLTKQLSVAIASGVFTPEQARSVAVNIGEQIGNVGIGLQASAQLTELYGEDGSNLLKDPLTLRVRLMEEATKGIAGDATRLGSAGSAVKGGSLSAMNKNVAVGGSVAAAAGAGALIGSAVGPIGTVTGAAVGAIAAGAALMFTMKQTAAELGRLSGISVQNQQNALNVNKEMSASVQLYYENLIKVKNAEGDIVGAKQAQEKYDLARAKLAEQNAKTVKAIADSYKSTAGNSQKALVDAAKKATGKKYKGTEQEAYVGQAQSMLANNLGIANNGKKGQMEYVLTMQMNAGNIKPSDMMAMIQTFGKSEKSMDKVMNIITKFGGSKAAETQQILGAFVDKNGNPNTKAQTEFLANISAAKTSAEADRLLNLYSSISQNQGILDVGVMVNYFQNNPEAAARLEGLLDNIKKNEGKLTYDVVTNFLPATGDVAINKKYFEGLNQAQRTVYTQEIATVISMSDAQIKKSDDFKKWLSEGKPLGGAQYANLSFANQRAKYADAIGQKVTENRVDLAIATPTTTGTTPSTGTKPRDTTLDELLKKLKFVRDAAIDAEGKLSYLMKIVSGDGITKFAGVSQQLLVSGTKGGVNREFISMLESMDNKTRAIYMRVEKGRVILTNQGKALKVAFDEKVIGEFQDTQVRAVQDSVAQQAAFVKLKAAGVDTSTALEMVADANLAVAINAKKITSKEINELAKSAVAAKNPVSTLAIELEKAANAARQKMVDVTNQIKILTEAKTKMGLSTEDLKIISEDPVLMQALEKLLNGDGTRKQLGEFENLIRSTINNIKGAKVKVEGDFTALTEGIEVALQNSDNKAQDIFDKLSADIQKGLDLRRASIEKEYRDQINTAQTAVDAIQKTIDDGYDPATKLIIPGLQSKVDAAQQAINESNDSYDTLVKTIEDKYLTQTLDNLGNIVSSGLLAKPQAEVDRLTKSIEDLQNKGGIDAIGLTQFGAAAAGDFKGNNLTLAEAEKAITDVQGFIEKTYSRPIEMLQQAIAGQQRTLEITYTRSIEEIQKKIEDIQTKIAKEFDKPLSKIQEESTKLSEDLAVMDNAADAINKKYETQENALAKIAQLNQDIVEQQKQQLGLADALSKGDISAAAAAVQDMRATQAAKALGSQQGTLAKAKEAELAAIKSPSGLTRDQITERQYALERASYQIQQLQKVEQEKILALQEQIYTIENNPDRLKILEDIRIKEDKIYELDNLKLGANNAIYAVQAQIATRNNEISAQQVLLTKAQTDLKAIEDAREAELKAAEIKHATSLVGLKENLKLAEDNLKKANDALVIAQAALKSIEDAKVKAMKEVDDDEQKFKDMVAAIDLATASTVLFEDQLTAAKTAANNLKTALENLTIAKDAESKAEIKRQQDAAQAEANRIAAEKKAADDKAAEEKAVAELKAKQEADAKNKLPPPLVIPRGALQPQYISSGGMVPKYFAAGGFSKGTDTIPSMLTPGEFVIKKSAVDSYGVNNLSKINSGMSPDSSVYNYSLSVNVSGNNLNADDIASTVMQKIKYIDGQRVRGQR